MNLPAIKAPFAVTFRLCAGKTDALRHLISAFQNVSLNQENYTCISHYREFNEHALVIEASSPISSEIRSIIRFWLQSSTFLIFISENETNTPAPKE